MLDYETLDVYQCALRFATLAFQVLRELPKGHAELGDQLRRAAMSVPLNIAEGAGKTSARERARFHGIARGSAMECAAVLDLLRIQDAIDDNVAVEAKVLCVRLVAMPSRMAR